MKHHRTRSWTSSWNTKGGPPVKPLPTPPGIVADSCATEGMHRKHARRSKQPRDCKGKSPPGIRYTSSSRVRGRCLNRKSYVALSVVLLSLIALTRILLTYKVNAQGFDEPCHVAAAIEYLDKGTYTLDPVHPPLSRIAIGIPLYLAGERFPIGRPAIHVFSTITTSETAFSTTMGIICETCRWRDPRSFHSFCSRSRWFFFGLAASSESLPELWLRLCLRRFPSCWRSPAWPIPTCPRHACSLRRCSRLQPGCKIHPCARPWCWGLPRPSRSWRS